MTKSSQSSRAEARGVLDPTWEDELRGGQEAEGEAGSVDAELAFVHLLRHARAPEALEPAQLDAIWSDIDAAITPEPWWRKAWVWWSAPAVAAAAVLFVVVVQPGANEAPSVARSEDKVQLDAEASKQDAPAPAPGLAKDEALSGEAEEAPADDAVARAAAKAQAQAASRSPQGNAAETYFKQLAPSGRRAIRVSVDDSRDSLRAQLLDTARKGG